MKSEERRPHRVVMAGALVLALATVLGGPAESVRADAVEAPVGTGITPATVILDLTERRHEFDVIVFNNSERPRSIDIEVVELSHGLDGTPLFGAAVEQVTVTDGQQALTLLPGEREALSLIAEFPDQPALHAAVLGRVAPDEVSDAVDVQTQFASLVLLRGPRPWDQSLVVREVGVEGAADGGTARIYADVENVGDTYVIASGTFTLNVEGRPVTVSIDSETVIPGSARRLRNETQLPDDITGPVDVTVELETGQPHSETIDFGDRQNSLQEEDEQQDGSPQGAVLTFGGESAPAALSIAALVLLVLAVALLFVLWRRRKEEDDEELTAVDISAGGSDAL